jgi:predicted DNA-binding transcriptional regulator AlpA
MFRTGTGGDAMSKKHRGLALTPIERREVAALLETIRAELGDEARDARGELAELLGLWDEVVDDMAGSGATLQSTSPSAQPAAPQPQLTGLETMSRADIARLLKASVSTVQRMEKDNRLPKRLKTGPRLRRHLVKDVQALIDTLKQDRDVQPRRRLNS